jgi:hypothetical protein
VQSFQLTVLSLDHHHYFLVWGWNPGPCVCKAKAAPLSHVQPLLSFLTRREDKAPDHAFLTSGSHRVLGSAPPKLTCIRPLIFMKDTSQGPYEFQHSRMTKIHLHTFQNDS